MTLTFLEFVNNVCTSCRNCDSARLKRMKLSFCYMAYKKNNNLYMSYSYQILRKIKNLPISIVEENALVEEVFCKSGLCGNIQKQKCKNLNSCATKFANQMKAYASTFVNYNILPFKINIDAPKLIFGGSKKWIDMVKKME